MIFQLIYGYKFGSGLEGTSHSSKGKIVVNGTPAYLNRKRLERDIKREVPNLLSALQSKADEFINTEAKDLLQEKLNKKFGKGYIEAIEISPLGAPERDPNDFFHEYSSSKLHHGSCRV